MNSNEARPDWDARTYDRVADPQTRWGLAVLDRLQLRGDEVVLDAGCGSGRVTEQLVDRLPGGRVIALDASEAMLVEARRRLAVFGDRVSFVRADLMDPLPIAGPVDAILSTATFHWVPDHDRLFANLAAVLRPGGRLVAQAGGTGNVAHVLDVAKSVAGHEAGSPYCFPDPDEERARLEAAGFVEVETWLQPEPTRFERGDELTAFLRTVCLRDFVARLADETEIDAFVREVARRLDPPVIDYIRINIVATRG